MPEINKSVRVHTCYSMELSEPQPEKCVCREFVTVDEAEDRVRRGLANYVIRFDKGKPYEDLNQLCMTGRHLQTPRTATIEKAHIERAYVAGDLQERIRIEIYGLETLLARVRIGKDKTIIPLRQEPEGGREHDYGRAVFGGIGRDERTRGNWQMKSWREYCRRRTTNNG